MKRLFDLSLSVVISCFLFIPIMVIAFFVMITSAGSILYWSNRIGQYNKIFKMPKFRTMKVNTPAVATHLLENPEKYLTPIGTFLRKTSLDELPQLWSILKRGYEFCRTTSCFV